jgi:SAM-dependent methyltransferase
MNEEHSSIHDFDFNLICDYFALMDRQGPGSPEVTVKALSFLDTLKPESQIADIGCGTGGQTMTLALHTKGQITGIDLFPRFIDLFNDHARQRGLHDRVKGVVASMEKLPFGEEELDVIWSEGAIYNIGFERGIREWRKFLKPGGFLAVTEASWFTEERPGEIDEFWKDAYPEIDTIPNKVAQMQNAGYVPAKWQPLSFRKTAGLNIFIYPKRRHRKRFWKNIPAINRWRPSLKMSAGRHSFMPNTRSITVMYFTSVKSCKTGLRNAWILPCFPF